MPRLKRKQQLGNLLTTEPPRLGVNSNLFKGTAEDVARAIAAHGLESVELLPRFGDLAFGNAADVLPRTCKKMSAPFKDAQLMIAGVAAHANFLDPDVGRRRRNVKMFDAIVAHARDLGTKNVVTETGTLAAHRPWEDFADNHTEVAFAEFVKQVTPSIKLAKQYGTRILFACHSFHVISSVEKALRLVEEFGATIGFVMDPVVLLSRGQASSPKRPIQQTFAELGGHSPVGKARDIRYVGGERTTPRAGTGTLDFADYLRLWGECQPGAPLIIEHAKPSELAETVDFIDRHYDLSNR